MPARKRTSAKPVDPTGNEAAETPTSGSGDANLLIDLVEGVFKCRNAIVRLTQQIEDAEAELAQLETNLDGAVDGLRAAERALKTDFPGAKRMLKAMSAEDEPVDEVKREVEEPAVLAKRVLTKEEAEQVLEALDATFTLGEFTKKLRSLFPGSTGKGAMNLLGERVKSAGGKGMGTKFKKTE